MSDQATLAEALPATELVPRDTPMDSEVTTEEAAPAEPVPSRSTRKRRKAAPIFNTQPIKKKKTARTSKTKLTQKGKTTKTKATPKKAVKKNEEVTYELHEIVVAFHIDCMYEAKILRVNEDHKGRRGYLLHYQGWARKWDEWASPDRMRKRTPASLQFLKDMNASAKKNKKGKKGKKGAGASKPTKAQAANLARQLSQLEVAVNLESKADQQARRDIPVKIPIKLEDRLVKDYTRMGDNMILSLPRDVSITSIFEQYLNFRLQQLLEVHTKKSRGRKKSKKGRRKKNAAAPKPVPTPAVTEDTIRVSDEYLMVEEMCSGLKVFFEHAFHPMLLYGVEQVQFAELQVGPGSLCEIYGCEHLLRLFVKLPIILAATTMQPKERSLFLSQVGQFLGWLEWQAELFVGDYEPIDANYKKRLAQSANMEFC